MTTIDRNQPMRPTEIDLLNQVDTNTDNIATQTARLTQEIINRTNDDNVLQQNIDAESKARADADTALQSHIDAEARTRADADTTLQNNIDTEESERKAADTTLQQNINNEASARQKNATEISNEITARTNADTGLQSSINEINAKFPVQTVNIGDAQVTSIKLATNAVSTDIIIDKNVTVAKLEQAIQDQLTFLQSVPAQEFGTSNAIDVQANSNTSININFGSTKTKVPIVLCGLQHASDNISYIVTGVTNQQFSVTVYNHSSTNVSGITIDWLAISGR